MLTMRLNLNIFVILILIYFKITGIISPNIIKIGFTNSLYSTTEFSGILQIYSSLNKTICLNNFNLVFLVQTGQFETIGFSQYPIGFNKDAASIHMYFGPQIYYNPYFYGFKPNSQSFKFPTDIFNIFELSEQWKYNVIYEVSKEIMKNDSNKTLLIITSEKKKPDQPWLKDNIYTMMQNFQGILRYAIYRNESDADYISSVVVSEQFINIVLDLDWKNTVVILKKMSAQNLLSWRYRWMVFFSGFSHLYKSDNVDLPYSTNFTVIDFTNSPTATLNDAIKIKSDQGFYLADIAQCVFRLMEYETCNKVPTGVLSLSTGEIGFDSSGKMTRNKWAFQVYRNIQPFSVVGTVEVNAPLGNVVVNIPEVSNKNFTREDILKQMRFHNFRVAALVEEPFVYVDSNGQVNSNYPGYSIEMMQEIMKNLNVSYQLRLIISPHGLLNNGKLNGVLGLVQNGSVDMAIGPITFQALYRQYLDYSVQYKSHKLAIIYKKFEVGVYKDMFQFIEIFDWKVWLMILGACIIYAAVLTILNLLSANKARFSFLDSMLFTLGSQVQGVTTEVPDKISGQILVVFWWIFNLCILLAYVGNYGALRTSFRLQASINSLFDLNQQYTYSFSTLKDSAVDHYLTNSPFTDVQKISRLMKSEYEDKFKSTVNETMDIVRSDIKHAFIYDDAVLEKFKGERCLIVTNGFDQFFYSFALMKNSEFTSIIDTEIRVLQSNGFLNSLEKKYYQSQPTVRCLPLNWLGTIFNFLSQEFTPSLSDSLTVQQISGLFIIMLFGLIIAIFVAIIEIIVRKCRKKE